MNGMEIYREKKPGSARLGDEHYEEMGRLGLESESAYLKHLLNEKSRSRSEGTEGVPSSNDLALQLALQRAEFENQRLRDKLDETTRSREETLSGLGDQVGKRLEEELMKRDFEALKKENAQQGKELDKLEAKLRKAETTVEEKQRDLAELTKKLGYVELGKALLPSAINGLAKQYPKQLQGLAMTLGSLGGEMQALPESDGLSEEQENLLTIAEYLQDTFGEGLNEFIALSEDIGQLAKMDVGIFQKLRYYLAQLRKVQKNRDTENVATNEPNNDKGPEEKNYGNEGD